MALAELHAESGRPAAALEVLRASSNQAAPAPPPGAAPHADALALLNRRANLLLSLGQQVCCSCHRLTNLLVMPSLYITRS